jgi:hypothetical protein
MDRIYSQARSVRICISQQSTYSDLFTYKMFFRWLRDESDPEVWLIPVMRELFSHRYFKRAWVMQEVTLARTLYLLVNDDELLLSCEVVDRLILIAELPDYQPSGSDCHRLPGVLRLRWSASLTPFTSIVTCLHAGVTSQCTDARDKVFAVLSLMDPQSRSFIPVDYSLDVVTVYASAIVAIVASHGNLDILSYAGCVKAIRESVWLTEPALTLEWFEEFLDDKDQGRHWPVLGQFSGNEIGPWRSNIEIYTTEELNVIPDLAVQAMYTPVVFCQKPHNLTETNILPRFQVRAHFIDKVAPNSTNPFLLQQQSYWSGSACSFGEHICDNRPRLGLGYDWILPFFISDHIIASTYQLSTFTESANKAWQDAIPGYNLVDLITFAEIAVDRGKDKQVFTTSNSVGFARYGFLPGDEIWAMDGAKTPFVLRKTEHNSYRIVANCYLWAALELDYWNPGTKKGRWSEDRPAHNEQQTHIIEIH